MQRDPQDRRQIRVSITHLGQKKLAQIKKTQWGGRQPENEPLACFSAEEIQEFDRLLTKLNGHLRQISRTDNEEIE